MMKSRMFAGLAPAVVAWPMLALAAAASADTIELILGDDDGFGGTQGPSSLPGDPYVSFSTPTIAPGEWTGVAATDASTIAPWTPYTFTWFVPLDLVDFECVYSAELLVQHGSVGRRPDGSGFGFAVVSASFEDQSTTLGEFWSLSTGPAGGPTEESVKMTALDLAAVIDPGAAGTLTIVIDGASLVAPVDQFAIDFVRVRVVGRTVSCPADLDCGGSIDGADLGLLLSEWGRAGAADLDGSGVVDGADLGLLLAAWGQCD